MEQKPIQVETRGKYTIKIYKDEKAPSPSQMVKPFGTIYTNKCGHEPDTKPMTELCKALNCSWDGLIETLNKDYYYLLLKYCKWSDCITTTPPQKIWNEDIIGVVLVAKTNIKSYGLYDYGEERVYNNLTQQIISYNKWRNGEIYRYCIYDENNSLVDTIGSFYSWKIMQTCIDETLNGLIPENRVQIYVDGKEIKVAPKIIQSILKYA